MTMYTSVDEFYFNEKELPNREEGSPFFKTFTSFSGSDVIAFFDGEMIGEVQAVTWKKKLNSFCMDEIEGQVVAAKFDRELPFGTYGKEIDIRLLFMNEYGQSKMYLIEGVTFTEEMGGISVDSVVEDSLYQFKAKRLVEINDYIYDVEGKIAYLEENKNSTDRYAKTVVKVYKDEILSNLLDGRYRAVFHHEYKEFLEYQKLKAEELD